VISDTHGLLRPEALEVLRGTDLIIHAGDVGSPDVLVMLGRLAKVAAVCGNTDREPWTVHLPATQVVEVDGQVLYVLHDLGQLDLDPAAAGFQAVIFGHSHRPAVNRSNGVLYLNPGSAGPRRFELPVTVAKLQLTRGTLEAQIIHLQA
jgi:putative phosphoesterase